MAVAARQRVDGASQGRSQVLGVVVGAFQRDPRERPLVVLGPLEQCGRLPVPRRRHQEGDRDVAHLHQPPDQAGARDEAAAEGGAWRRGQRRAAAQGERGGGRSRSWLTSSGPAQDRRAASRAHKVARHPVWWGGHTWVHACLRRRAGLAGCAATRRAEPGLSGRPRPRRRPRRRSRWPTRVRRGTDDACAADDGRDRHQHTDDLGIGRAGGAAHSTAARQDDVAAPIDSRAASRTSALVLASSPGPPLSGSGWAPTADRTTFSSFSASLRRSSSASTLPLPAGRARGAMLRGPPTVG